MRKNICRGRNTDQRYGHLGRGCCWGPHTVRGSMHSENKSSYCWEGLSMSKNRSFVRANGIAEEERRTRYIDWMTDVGCETEIEIEDDYSGRASGNESNDVDCVREELEVGQGAQKALGGSCHETERNKNRIDDELASENENDSA